MKRRIVILAFILAVTAGACLGLWHVKWQENLLADLPHGTPELAAAQAYLQSFTGNEPVAVDVDASRCPNPAADAAAAADVLAEQLMKTGYFKHVDAGLSLDTGAALWNAVTSRLPYLIDPGDYTELHKRMQEAGKRLDAFKRQAQEDPFAAGLTTRVSRDPLGMSELVLAKLRGFSTQNVTMTGTRLTSLDGKHLLMLAYPKFPASETRQGKAMFDAWQACVQAVRKARGRVAPVFYAIGPHRAYVDNAEQIKHDVGLSTSVTLVLILCIALLALRRPWQTPLRLLPSFMGLATGLAAVGFFYQSFSLIIWGMISSLLGITVDYGLHVLMAIQRAPQDPVAASRIVRVPVWACALTTASSFLALFATHFPGQYQLALFSFCGVLISGAFAILALPYLVPAHPQDHKPPIWNLDAWGFAMEAWGQKHWKEVIAAALALGFGAWLGLRHLQFEGDPESMNALSRQTRVAEQHFTQAFGDPTGRLLAIQKGDTAEDILRQGEKLDAWLQTARAKALLEPTTTLAGVIPSRATQAERARRFADEFGPAGGKLEAAVRAAGVRADFMSGTFTPWVQAMAHPEPPLEPEDFFRLGLGNMIRDRWLKSSDRLLLATPLKPKPGVKPEQVEQELRQVLPNTTFLDKRGLAGSILNILKMDLKPAVFLAMLLVGLIVFLFKRDLKIVLVALLPLAVALWLTLGTLAWLGVKINLINLAAAPALMGIGVNYTVFRIECILARLRGQRLPSGSILLTAVETMVGFGALILAGHPALRSVGIALTASVAWSLLCAMLLVPLLMNFIYDRRVFSSAPQGPEGMQPVK